MQLDIVVTHTPSLWLRVANWFGADIKWTHALLRYRVGRSSPRIIQAAGAGVVDEHWRPERYHEYRVYRLQDWSFDDEAERQGVYERMYSFAAGEVGKRYRYEALPLILWRVVKRVPRFTAAGRYTSLAGTARSALQSWTEHFCGEVSTWCRAREARLSCRMT